MNVKVKIHPKPKGYLNWTHYNLLCCYLSLQIFMTREYEIDCAQCYTKFQTIIALQNISYI